jgi:hypothetical protein
MLRSSLALALVVTLTRPAAAYLMYGNHRLDHALWPDHEPKLVVAGEIRKLDLKKWPENVLDGPGRDVTVHFKIESVILGPKNRQGQTLTLPATAFIWPDDLVPLREGTHCILVLRESSVARQEASSITAVVPGRKRQYQPAADSIAARQTLAEELLAQLAAEKSPRRQRALLVQLAPVLKKEQAKAIEEFAQSKEAWVRRAALACLIYAAEDPKHLKIAAQDVQDFFQEFKGKQFISDLGEPETRYAPTALLFDHYFFLEPRSWKWGSRWTEEEADKHLRILRAMLQFGIIDAAARKILEGK